MNQHLINRLEAITLALMAEHKGGAGLPNAVIGNERETFLREFLQKVFPSHYRFTSGAITDSNGNISGQIDIAIEYPFICSFPMPASHERLMLAESVLAAIEVKSDISSQWDQVTASVRKTKLLSRNLSPTINIGRRPSAQVPCIAVGYRGHATIDGLRARLESTPAECRPDAALVIESGCFFGFGGLAQGPGGLFMLCAVLSKMASEVPAMSPDLIRYLQ